jgi:hypothetical protein
MLWSDIPASEDMCRLWQGAFNLFLIYSFQSMAESEMFVSDPNPTLVKNVLAHICLARRIGVAGISF